MNAIVFLYKRVPDIDLGDGIDPARAKRKKNLPVVLTKEQVASALDHMSYRHALMAKLLWDCGLRVSEFILLRIKDVDFGQGRIYVHDTKGGKDRAVVLPESMVSDLRKQIDYVPALHKEDLSEGFGEVYIPDALSRKYPNAVKEAGWRYVFPAKKLSEAPRSGKIMRLLFFESGLGKAVYRSLNRAGIHKKASFHTFRHPYTTHMLENGVNIRIVKELMGHADLKTTEIHTHVKGIDSVKKTLDFP